MPTDAKNELWVLATRVAKHIGHGLLDIQFRVGLKRLKDRPDGLWIYLHDATQPLTCGTPDIRVMVLGPPSRSIKDRGWMALTDPTLPKKLLDVVNLSDHSNVYLATRPTFRQSRQSLDHQWHPG